MPITPHVEKHFMGSAAVRDIVIGMADGLTVPFALAAGISGVVAASPNATALVVTAGLAEIAAGSIAMGLGGRSEEHTSELQSLAYLVCRLLLEKKKKKPFQIACWTIRYVLPHTH